MKKSSQKVSRKKTDAIGAPTPKNPAVMIGVVSTVLISVCAGKANAATGKEASRMVTSEMRGNAIENVEQYEWAASRKHELEAFVQPYMEISLERLWRMLPSQEMGRDTSVYRHGKGCPQSFIDNGGEVVGRGDFHVDVLGRPWQVKCLRCGNWYPKNDFASYYESALDETGRFRLGEGDPRYLEPRQGVEGEAREWIDDGTGVEYKGLKWFFAAKYAETVWRELTAVAEGMGKLYTLTENPEYARRAAVILDRMADLYPEMDEKPHRERGMKTSYGPGKVIGTGWEVGAIRVPVAWTYDYIYDAIKKDSDLVSFVNRMSREHNGPAKGSFEALDNHLRNNLLILMVEDIISDGVPESRGRPQTAVATIAACLDDPRLTPDYFDWLFDESGGIIPKATVDAMTREGLGITSGHTYIFLSGVERYKLAEILRRYGHEDYDLYEKYPSLMHNVFTMNNSVRILDKTVPQIGDGGGSMEIVDRKHFTVGNLIDGYRVFGTPEIAREIFHRLNWKPDAVFSDKALTGRPLHGGNTPVIHHTDIYEENPGAFLDGLEAEMERMPGQSAPFESFNSGGFGLAALEAPWREHPRAAAVFYGRCMLPAHGHGDRLSLHLWGFGEVLMPDMGYPLYMGDWPKRHGFTRHTISHNTLMINDTRQGRNYSGKTELFADAGPVRIADINGNAPQDVTNPLGSWKKPTYEGADTYRRVVVMVDVNEEDSYLLDLFWARGGENHRLIQNGSAPHATAEGLRMDAQEGGTFAGVDVEYGEAYDGELTDMYAGSGFQFLKNVEKDTNPQSAFTIDWEVDARYPKPGGWNAHMRLHNLTPVDEVALADGLPSNGHPDAVRYSIRSRFGKDLRSQFISVIEPYQDEPFVRSVELLDQVSRKGEPFSAAVEVNLTDGRRDVILVNEEAGPWNAGDLFLNGRLGMARFDKENNLETLAGIAAEEVRAPGKKLTLSPAVYSGMLDGKDSSDPMNVRLRLSEETGEDARGEYIVIDNAEAPDASYLIEGVTNPGVINIGSTPLYCRFESINDYDKGVVDNVKVGEKYIIPRTILWEKE